MVQVIAARERSERKDEQRATFLRLFAEYHAALQRLASAYCATAADREDLMQEIALALWESIPRFRAQCSERTWLYRVAHNTAISHSCKLRNRGRREQGEDAFHEARSASPSIEQTLLVREREELLLHSIRELPPADRQILTLHLEGLNYAEIAEITGQSSGSLATRVSRLRAKLAEAIRRRAVQDRR